MIKIGPAVLVDPLKITAIVKGQSISSRGATHLDVHVVMDNQIAYATPFTGEDERSNYIEELQAMIAEAREDRIKLELQVRAAWEVSR